MIDPPHPNPARVRLALDLAADVLAAEAEWLEIRDRILTARCRTYGYRCRLLRPMDPDERELIDLTLRGLDAELRDLNRRADAVRLAHREARQAIAPALVGNPPAELVDAD